MKVRELIERLVNLSEEDKNKEMNSFVSLNRDDLEDIKRYLDEDNADYGVLCGTLDTLCYDEENDTMELGSTIVGTNSFYTIEREGAIYQEEKYNPPHECDCDTCGCNK